MKTKLVTAVTTALVAGLASTTFAAANPFADVPTDHWSYDAIAQLAADGVVDGYGDGTYRGGESITRYEMSMMIARAMAKSGLSAADKAMLDKLSAEYGDELQKLGVRVAALEKKTDNMRFYGIIRYTYENDRKENQKRGNSTNNLRIRLMSDMKINAHWTGHARVEYGADGDAGDGRNLSTAKNSTTAVCNRTYVTGVYGKTTINLGKFPGYTYSDDGLVFDDDMAGAEVFFGDKAKIKLTAGRYTDKNAYALIGRTVNVLGVEVVSDYDKPLFGGIGYMRFASKDGYHGVNIGGKDYKDDSASIIHGGLGYRFTKDLALQGSYAKNTKGKVDSKERTSYSVALKYKGADAAKPGTYGLFVAYRQLGRTSSPAYTYNPGNLFGNKGIHVGGTYTLMRNTVGFLEYFNGKEITGTGANDEKLKVSTLFGRVEMYF